MMQSVQVIIERLKSHPEDFFGEINEKRALGGTYPKFHEVKDRLDNLLTDPQDGNTHRLWYLEPEEKEALLAAYKQARRERFEAKVFHILLTKQEPEETSTVTYKTAGRYTTGIIAPQNIINESLELLNKEFDKQYAKNSDPRS